MGQSKKSNNIRHTVSLHLHLVSSNSWTYSIKSIHRQITKTTSQSNQSLSIHTVNNQIPLTVPQTATHTVTHLHTVNKQIPLTALQTTTQSHSKFIQLTNRYHSQHCRQQPFRRKTAQEFYLAQPPANMNGLKFS